MGNTPKARPDGPRYRVKCDERTGMPVTLGAAQRQLDSIESLAAKGFAAACRLPHAIEVQYDATGPWTLAAEWLAPRILAARGGATVRTFDGHLTLTLGAWPKEAAARADAAGTPGSPQWLAELRKSKREYVVLTGDGRPKSTCWCQCDGSRADEDWVRYERWTAEGRVAHGYLHRECRGILQAG